MVELFVMRVQGCLDVPQALPVCELRKGQAQQLIIAGEPSNPVIAVIAAHAFVKLISRGYAEGAAQRPSVLDSSAVLPNQFGADYRSERSM